MTTAEPFRPLSAQNQDSLNTLIRAIVRSQQMFSLILVRCNYRMLRDRIVATLKRQLSMPLQEVHLLPKSSTLFTAIRQTLGDQQPTVLMVDGLETVENLTGLLRVANQSREEFRNHLPCPLVVWITDGILQRLIREATDFESWASITIEFESTPEDLSQFILKTTDEILAQLLKARENLFLDNHALRLEKDSPLRGELQAACESILDNHLESTSPELAASVEFVLGRVSDNNQAESRQHYERSLQLWQQTGNLARYAYVQFYLGFWWRNYVVRQRSDELQGLQKARVYLESSISTLEQIGREDRVAQFINYLGEVLHRQEDWAALDQCAHKAFTLHQRYCDGFRQARALGLMAEVAISNHNWSQAKYHAKLALTTWQQAAEKLLA
ncbi:MAG: sugar-binding protein, partial [Leptolyngbya sp. SIO1D8]|nr:sugar-binding protein [Leptolyngbya sp. SIO1D8]